MKAQFNKNLKQYLYRYALGYRFSDRQSAYFVCLATILALLLAGTLPPNTVNAQSLAPAIADAPVVGVQASQDEGSPNRDGDNEAEVEGWLLSRPDDGIGEWKVQTENDHTVTVIADSNTRIDRGVPPVDTWVKAKGILQSDQSILALRIRSEEYKVDEVVMRLEENGVLSTTIASRYGLIAVDTLLPSARIYLFRVANADRELEHAIDDIKNANDADVLWLEPNYVGSAPGGNPFKVWGWGGEDPTAYENQFAFDQVNLYPAFPQYTGKNVKIAVLDTGAALDHTALKDHLIAGWDMVADDALPQDEGPGFGWGHGTHIAGIVAHMAPDADIMPVRVLDANGRGNTFTLAYAIEWAVEHDADVINLSLGTPFDSRVLRDAVSDAINKGVIIVAAAGNNDSSAKQYPAAYDGVIAVSAVDSSNLKTSFANYGDWVDLSAPGIGITSTIIGTQGMGYASWSGTSMATGFVSGAVALIKQKQASADSSTVVQLLKAKGVNIDGSNSTNVGRLLNAAAALDVTGGTQTPVATATPQATASPQTTPSPQSTPTPVATSPSDTLHVYLPLMTK